MLKSLLERARTGNKVRLIKT